MHKINSHKNPISAPTETEIVHNSYFYTLYNAKFKDRNGAYLSIIIPDKNQEHLDIQVSPRIKLRITQKKDTIQGLTLTTYENGQEKGHIILSSFTLGHIVEFLEIIRILDIAALTERKISLKLDSQTTAIDTIKNLIEDTLSKNHQEHLISELLNKGVITDKDIVNTGYRKQQLNTFQRLWQDTTYLSEYQNIEELSNHSEEKTWQYFFEQNEWIFGYGLDYRFNKILQREAHTNTDNLNGSNSVIIDYILADNKFTTFVEIKKPSTKLFKADKNRANCWRLSNELYEAHSQILEQKYSAQHKFESNNAGYCNQGNKIHQNAYDSKSILIIGSWSELNLDKDQDKYIKERTFELFRRDLRNIEIITFDELYDRAKFIVDHN